MIRSYIGSRAIRGREWPQRIQGLVIRDYAQRHGLEVGLSATEWVMPDCYETLESLAQSRGAIILFSLYMLPPIASRRFAIYASGVDLHAALEDMPFDKRAWEDLILLEAVHAAA